MARLLFWLNAFIPRDVPGYTKVIPKGKHANKTAVPLPGVARLVPTNTFKDLEAGYLTDQRTFSTALTASVRMQSVAEIDLATLMLVRQTHSSSGTTEVNMTTGNETGFARANMSRCRFRVSTPSPMATVSQQGAKAGARIGQTGTLGIELNAAASDPLVDAAADIVYTGSIKVTIPSPAVSLSISFDGKIDAFPAFECYASVNSVTKTLFTAGPPPGHTVVNLAPPFFVSGRTISGKVSFP